MAGWCAGAGTVTRRAQSRRVGLEQSDDPPFPTPHTALIPRAEWWAPARTHPTPLIVPTLCVGMPTHRSAVTARPCQPGSQDCMQHDQINGIHQRHGIKTSAWPDCTTAHRRAVAPAFPRRAWERSNRVSRARRSRNNGAKRNCAGQTPLTHAARKPIFALLAQSSIAP